MSKKCQVTGKIPQTGNNVSHANNRTKRKFFPNLHTHKFWVESENRFVNLKVSAKGMRIIDKKGIMYIWNDQDLSSRELEIKIRDELGIDQKILTPKEIDKTAPAVYFPTPGNFIKVL